MDIGELKAGYNNTYEVGYKGLLGNRGRLSIDAWFQQRGEVNPPAFVATPSIWFVPSSLSSYLTSNITATATGLVGPTNAAAIAAALVPSLAATLGPAPLGTVTFEGQTRPDVLATYASVSGETLDVYGIDLGYDWLVNNAWTVTGTYSWLSDNIFPEVIGGNGLPYMSNSAKNKGTMALRYNNEVRGFSLEGRARYADGFPVNSGVFYTGKDIPSPAGGGATYRYEDVTTRTTFDLGATWHVPFFWDDVTWSINGTNITDVKQPTFAGTPNIGAMYLTKVQVKF